MDENNRIPTNSVCRWDLALQLAWYGAVPRQEDREQCNLIGQ